MIQYLLYIIGIGLQENQNKVNDPANAEKAECEYIQDAHQNFAIVEEQAEEERNPLVFGLRPGSSNICVHILVGVVDDDIRRLQLLYLFAAFGTDDAILIDFFAAVGAKLCLFFFVFHFGSPHNHCRIFLRSSKM